MEFYWPRVLPIVLLVVSTSKVVFAQSDEQVINGIRSSLESLRAQALSTGTEQHWSASIDGEDGTATGTIKAVFEDSKYYFASEGLNSLAATHYEIAYDSERYQVFDQVTGVLSYSNVEVKNLPFGIPIPSMLMWDFLSQDDDLCVGCQFNLSDLNQVSVWDNRLDTMILISFDPFTLAAVVKLSGGIIGDNEFDFFVTFTGYIGEQLPVMINRVSHTGVTFTSVNLANYTGYSGGSETALVAGDIIIIIDPTCEEQESETHPEVLGDPTYIGPVDPDSHDPGAITTITYGLTSISFLGNDPIIDPFAIDPSRADSIWDFDMHLFVINAP